MGITRITPNKLKWLVNSPMFKRNPFKTTWNVITWEFYRSFGLSRRIIYDQDLLMTLCPNDGVARLIHYFDYHEPDQFHFLDRFLQSGMVCIDVGANIGAYTLFISKRVGNRGKVFAFEPEKISYQKLCQNIKVNKLDNVIHEQLAVGNCNGFVEIVTNPDSAKTYTRFIDENNITDQGLCPCTTLDDYLSGHNLRSISYLKIDVEGFEYLVLKGSKETLKRTPPAIIQMELIDSLTARNLSNTQGIVNFLMDLHYQLFMLNQKDCLLYPWNKNRQMPSNGYFVHQNLSSQQSQLFYSI